MTYLEFLILFIGIPLFVISFWAFKKQCLDQKNIFGIGLLCLIALIYTTPWDNYLVMQNVWSYPPGVVLATIGYVPVEEYGFMLIQTMFGGVLWSPGVLGVFFLFHESGTYAGLILVWAFPPLAMQWGLGARVLLSSLKRWMPLWAGLTLYLCLADSYAISANIWTITSATRSGIEVGNLPIEEALFFALTNLFVFQGLCLWKAWRNR